MITFYYVSQTYESDTPVSEWGEYRFAFQAEPNMTFSQFVESEYNDVDGYGFFVGYDAVAGTDATWFGLLSDGIESAELTGSYPDTVIEDGKTYNYYI